MRALRLDAAPDDFDADLELPASVVCATCGAAACGGCVRAPRPAAVGAGAGVTWERPGGVWARLITTSEATARDAEGFFGALGDGSLGAALRFAVLAEVLAVGSTALAWALVAVAVAPALAVRLATDGAFRVAAGLWLGVAVAVFTALLVGAHALHGVALDRASRRDGGAALGVRALRFGFYACGWDLASSPCGVAAAFLARGARDAARLVVAAVEAPGHGTRAFLRAAGGLDEVVTRRVQRRAIVVALGASLPATAAALVLLAALG